MSQMVLRDLSFQERMALANLAQHPGFDILTRIMDEACRIAAAEPVKLDPNDAQYRVKLERLALMARAVNDFCQTVRKTVNTHIEAVVTEQEQEILDRQLEEDADRVLSTVRLLQRKGNQ